MDENDFPSDRLLAIASQRLKETALDRYLWLQENVTDADLSVGSEFTTRYCSFYRVRRSKEAGGWQGKYFAYLEELRTNPSLPSFEIALRHLSGVLPALRDGVQPPIEASFASKLLATLDAHRPVLDSEVLQHFKLKLPAATLSREERLSDSVSIFAELSYRLQSVLKSSGWPRLRKAFDEQFPGKNTYQRVTDTKALDLILWAGRGGIDSQTTSEPPV